jgi:hypothetical protein
LWQLLPGPQTVLDVWQTSVAYKVATGGLLGVLLVLQWGLSLARMGGAGRLAKKLYWWHSMLGAVAPLLLLLHSTTLGYGYVMMLSTLFLLNIALGVASPNLVPALRKHLLAWTSSHVAISAVVVVLAVHHAWTALYFE